METNLILTAKQWQLAPQLERTALSGGVQVVKNVPERTYLRITLRQWVILNRFKAGRTVPQVLEAAIEDRVSPALRRTPAQVRWVATSSAATSP